MKSKPDKKRGLASWCMGLTVAVGLSIACPSQSSAVP